MAFSVNPYGRPEATRMFCTCPVFANTTLRITVPLMSFFRASAVYVGSGFVNKRAFTSTSLPVYIFSDSGTSIPFGSLPSLIEEKNSIIARRCAPGPDAMKRYRCFSVATNSSIRAKSYPRMHTLIRRNYRWSGVARFQDRICRLVQFVEKLLQRLLWCRVLKSFNAVVDAVEGCCYQSLFEAKFAITFPSNLSGHHSGERGQSHRNS